MRIGWIFCADQWECFSDFCAWLKLSFKYCKRKCPAPEYWLEWTKNYFICQLTHVGGVIHQNNAPESTPLRFVALWKFSIALGGVTTLVGHMELCARCVINTEWRYQNFDRNRYRDFFYDTKFSKTETETFFRDQISLKPKPILFFRDQKFWNRNRDFFSDTKFSETETDTFLPRPNFPKPKPRLFSETKFFRNRNRYFSSETKCSETETETFFPRPNFSKPKPSKI